MIKAFPDLARAKVFTEATSAVAYVAELYDESCDKIRKVFSMLLKSAPLGDTPAVEATYPFVGMQIEKKDLCLDPRLSYGVLTDPGIYGVTLTRPDLFKDYYEEQLRLLLKHHKVPLIVGLSTERIPLPFVVDSSTQPLDDDQLWLVHNGFVLPNLSRIDDSIPNGTSSSSFGYKPLALFQAERVDFSLHRLSHYTGTSCEDFQKFILLSNYQRYIDAFVDYSKEQLLSDTGFTELTGPGGYRITREDMRLGDIPPLPTTNVQMPSYHLKQSDGQGITFMNIGVGPSNAKNITDHLAVLRPHCWLMLGHCAGLRSTQVLGDYVLAHAYVREDHVMDEDLPLWIPVPPLAEVQVALQEAVRCFVPENEVKERLRTGTILTTDNRNWELKSRELYQRFRQSRAIAVDMESATVAANGFRFRVPYGTLLCVSDKPIHGEIKLQGMANAFYRQRVNEHLKIGLESVRILGERGVDSLHSRKLRAFDDPAFR